MTFEVVFTKKAEQDFDTIHQYINLEFGSTAATRFKNLTIEFASILETFSELGSVAYPEKNIRAFVIHKRLKVFYRIKEQKVIILRLFDTGQHPDKT